MAKGKRTDTPDTLDTPSTKGMSIVWLKTRAYTDETFRLDKGVYVFEEVPARLTKLGKVDAEIFVGSVPSGKLNQIARWCGITNADEMSDEDILAKVIR